MYSNLFECPFHFIYQFTMIINFTIKNFKESNMKIMMILIMITIIIIIIIIKKVIIILVVIDSGLRIIQDYLNN